jgi:hypothetical protein
MKIKFKQEAATMNYGKVQAGDIVTVSDADGKAFIKSKLATKVKEEK